MQDICKSEIIWFLLESVAAAHQKATESEMRTHIGNTLKTAPFQEGGLKNKKVVRVNVAETELNTYSFLCESS